MTIELLVVYVYELHNRQLMKIIGRIKEWRNTRGPLGIVFTRKGNWNACRVAQQHPSKLIGSKICMAYLRDLEAVFPSC